MLAQAPSEAWQRLKDPDLDPLTRDRAAILALAGDYRVSFDFLETILFADQEWPARPYRSWATERVYVLEEREDFVSLQHILVMWVVDDGGTRRGPFVQKHWRQDWHFEPAQLLEYRGFERWSRRPLPAEQRHGRWVQSVYQVDDSPRYASIGAWTHQEEASEWHGSDVWRPLPRREHSVRDDYDALAGRNRLTVLPRGWVHEQDNRKLSFDASDATIQRMRAREVGVNRYDRIRGFDFAAGDAYWQATAPFWAAVRAGWERRLARGDLRIARRCGQEPAFAPFFRAAERLRAEDAPSPEEGREEIERILDCLAGPADSPGAPDR